jgi:hypothetical protein
MVRFWQRMAAIYGHKWTSAFGDTPFNDDGTLTLAGDTWQRGLTGVSEQDIAKGLQAALTSADGWPPTLPAFRALCFDIPAFSVVRREVSSSMLSDFQTNRSGFTKITISRLDTYRWQRMDQDKGDRLLREAYDEAVQYILEGGQLPDEYVAIPKETQKYAEPERTPEEVAEIGRKAQAAIDELKARFIAEPEGGQAYVKKHDGPCWRNSHADCGC